MNKPTKTFRLPKAVKAALTTIVDPHARGHYKRMMIDACLEAEKRPVSNKKDAKGLADID